MHGPPLIGWLLVALCGASGTYCLLRMRAGTPELRRGAGGEALMGLGMAAMALPATALWRGAWGPVVLGAGFAAVFTAAALHELLRARPGRPGGAHHLHHAVASAAMVYMALAMSGASSAPGGHAHTAGGVPPLTGALLVYFAGYVLRSGFRLVPVAAEGPARPVSGWVDRPELAVVCRAAMGTGMFAMLLSL